LDHQSSIKGAVLSGSLVLVPDYISDFTIKLGEVLSLVAPKMGLMEIEKEGLSRDPEVVEAYKDDPLVINGKFTTRISAEINKAIKALESNLSRFEVPALLLHGGADPIVNPACSKYLYAGFSSTQKQLLIYEGLFHEIYNEPEKDKVLQDVLEWIEGQLIFKTI
jgi:alpha-beta hydrolase superfamily lysophospholipase